jgi:hypothetical protein
MLTKTNPHTSSGSPLTLVIYITLLAALIAVAAYYSRYVLFQPWTNRISMTVAAHEPGDGGELFVIGGRRPNQNMFDDVLRLRIPEQRISTAASFGSPVLGAAAAVMDGTLYLFGGYDGKQPSSRIAALPAEDPDAGLRSAGELPAPLAFGAAVPLDGSIYYFGGWDGTEKQDGIYRFDPETGTVERAGSLPKAREKLAAAAVSGEIFLLGGYGPENSGDETVWRYDPESRRCTPAARLTEAIDRVSAAAADSTLFFMTPKGNQAGSLYRFSAASSEVNAAGSLPVSVRTKELAAVNGTLYVVGGSHPRFQRQIGVWKLLQEGGRYTAEAVRLRGYAWN